MVLSESGKDTHGATRWQCRCLCGTLTTARGSHLTSGRTSSCGCGVAKKAREPRTHGQTNSPLYRRWRGMLARCENSNNPEFRNYGGRGIKVCDAWHAFEAFFADMGATFSGNLELDRRDNNGNYEPGNCHWITRGDQQHNKRSNHRVGWRGRDLTIQQWSELLGIKANTLIYRLLRGWTVERAMTFGVDPKKLLELANK